MIKSLFIEFKFGDQAFSELGSSGANHLIVAQKPLNKERWQKLKNFGATLAISVSAFDYGGCPANSQSLRVLTQRVKKALGFSPKQIWLDHFRFDGHWEAIQGARIPGVHKECEWCQGKDRAKILAGVAEKVVNLVGKRAGVGYFAVPFKSKKIPQLVFGLGQDHGILGRIFDFSSPMLYHRMIKKPVSYISEYVKWIFQKTRKPVLPIIQVKDMPDDLPDRLFGEEIGQAFSEARKPPSLGVSFFSWDHAVEKGKTRLVKELFGST